MTVLDSSFFWTLALPLAAGSIAGTVVSHYISWYLSQRYPIPCVMTLHTPLDFSDTDA